MTDPKVSAATTGTTSDIKSTADSTKALNANIAANNEKLTKLISGNGDKNEIKKLETEIKNEQQQLKAIKLGMDKEINKTFGFEKSVDKKPSYQVDQGKSAVQNTEAEIEYDKAQLKDIKDGKIKGDASALQKKLDTEIGILKEQQSSPSEHWESGAMYRETHGHSYEGDDDKPSNVAPKFDDSNPAKGPQKESESDKLDNAAKATSTGEVKKLPGTWDLA